MCAIYNVRSRSGRPWNVKYICKWYYIKGKRFCSSWSGFSLTYLLYLTFIQEYIPYKHKHKQKHKYIYIYIYMYIYIYIYIYIFYVYLSICLSLSIYIISFLFHNCVFCHLQVIYKCLLSYYNDIFFWIFE